MYNMNFGDIMDIERIIKWIHSDNAFLISSIGIFIWVVFVDCII